MNNREYICKGCGEVLEKDRLIYCKKCSWDNAHSKVDKPVDKPCRICKGTGRGYLPNGTIKGECIWCRGTGINPTAPKNGEVEKSIKICITHCMICGRKLSDEYQKICNICGITRPLNKYSTPEEISKFKKAFEDLNKVDKPVEKCKCIDKNSSYHIAGVCEKVSKPSEGLSLKEVIFDAVKDEETYDVPRIVGAVEKWVEGRLPPKKREDNHNGMAEDYYWTGYNEAIKSVRKALLGEV